MIEVSVETYLPTTDKQRAFQDGWGDPQPVHVLGWQPATNTSGGVKDHRQTVEDTLLIMCSSNPGTHHYDRWNLDGHQFLQQGRPNDYTNGPYGFGGFTVQVRRVTG